MNKVTQPTPYPAFKIIWEKILKGNILLGVLIQTRWFGPWRRPWIPELIRTS